MIRLTLRICVFKQLQRKLRRMQETNDELEVQYQELQKMNKLLENEFKGVQQETQERLKNVHLAMQKLQESNDQLKSQHYKSSGHEALQAQHDSLVQEHRVRLVELQHEREEKMKIQEKQSELQNEVLELQQNSMYLQADLESMRQQAASLHQRAERSQLQQFLSETQGRVARTSPQEPKAKKTKEGNAPGAGPSNMSRNPSPAIVKKETAHARALSATPQAAEGMPRHSMESTSKTPVQSVNTPPLITTSMTPRTTESVLRISAEATEMAEMASSRANDALIKLDASNHELQQLKSQHTMTKQQLISANESVVQLSSERDQLQEQLTTAQAQIRDLSQSVTVMSSWSKPLSFN